jgi:peptidoglycan/LPS O-acetylase OafA/YrhL
MVTVAHTYTPVADATRNLKMANPVPGMGTGAIGVDLFFVISGFIMVYTTWDDFGAPGSSIRFFARRLIRIAPLYWIATALLIILFRYWVGLSLERQWVDAPTFAASLLFFSTIVRAAVATPFFHKDGP